MTLLHYPERLPVISARNYPRPAYVQARSVGEALDALQALHGCQFHAAEIADGSHLLTAWVDVKGLGARIAQYRFDPYADDNEFFVDSSAREQPFSPLLASEVFVALDDYARQHCPQLEPIEVIQEMPMMAHARIWPRIDGIVFALRPIESGETTEIVVGLREIADTHLETSALTLSARSRPRLPEHPMIRMRAPMRSDLLGPALDALRMFFLGSTEQSIRPQPDGQSRHKCQLHDRLVGLCKPGHAGASAAAAAIKTPSMA